jgi:hypothetical protein
MASTPTQIIEGQYLDQQKLMALLQYVYGTSEGKNNFRVEVNYNTSQQSLADIMDTAQTQPVQDLPLGARP